VLFHYAGEPGKHCNFSVIRRVKERLEIAGFKVLRFDGDAQGIYSVESELTPENCSELD
jgi:predicted methyltransferase